MTSDKQEKIDEQLRPLYAELQKYGQSQDWDRALKVTKKSLFIEHSFPPFRQPLVFSSRHFQYGEESDALQDCLFDSKQ